MANFTVDTKTLCAELNLLAPVYKAANVIPILATVLVEFRDNLRLTSTNLDVTLTSEIAIPILRSLGDEPTRHCLPFRELHAAFRLFGGETVMFSQKPNNRVEVQCERSRHLLADIDAKDFPLPESVKGEKITIEAAQLSNALARVAPCVDVKEGRWQTAGVCFESNAKGFYLIATNGVQLAFVELPRQSKEFQFIVPLTSLPGLQAFLDIAEGNVDFTINPNNVAFDCENRKCTVRLMTGQFPNWEMVVPKNNEHSMNLAGLETAIKRCMVTATEDRAVKSSMKLNIGKAETEVSTYGGDHQSFETLPIGCESLNGDKLEIRINAGQILGFLRLVKAPILQFRDNRSQLLFTDENDPSYQYISMPLRPE